VNEWRKQVVRIRQLKDIADRLKALENALSGEA
jgi:hypothetical protein